jgi:hypothetical protein
MAGENPLDIQEYRDDFQVSYGSHLLAADIASGESVVLWVPPRRTVVIDDIFFWAANAVETTAATIATRLLRAVGPLGATGGDADMAAVLTADRTVITDVNFGDAAGGLSNSPVGTIFETTIDNTNNLLQFNYTDSSGNSGLTDFLVITFATASSTELDGVNTGIRWRSRER